jgi:Holliday junction resolvasome RuvABC endonuclease subunit
MCVVGLDLSLTATGFACTLGTESSVRQTEVSRCGTVKPPAAMREGARLTWIVDALETASGMFSADLVIVEDIPTHARSAGLTAQLHGAVKVALHRAQRPRPALVTPATLKTFATGKGNADKIAVVVAARDRLHYSGLDDNEADALWLLQIGLHHLRHHDAIPLPQTHLRALDKIVWPS